MVPYRCRIGILYAVRFRNGWNRFHQSKECRQHYNEKLNGLLPRYDCIRTSRLRSDARWRYILRTYRCSESWRSYSAFRLQQMCRVRIQLSILCYRSNDSFRCYGRAYKVHQLLHLLIRYQPCRLSYWGSLDLGRRLARTARLRWLCRFNGNTYGRRSYGSYRCRNGRTPYRQVQQGR